MTKLYILLALLIVFIIAFEYIKKGKFGNLLSVKEDAKYQYKQKNFFMTRAEHECYDALMIAVGDSYYVFPQVHLPSIVDSRVVGQNWRGAFKHINQKSVDFVLCDKAYISPKLVIELDDRTHERGDRIERDVEVERVVKGAGLPLLRLENHGSFNPEELEERISKLFS